MDEDILKESPLTTEEIRQYVEGGEKLTDEQIETIKDFIALAAVITYEDLKKKALDFTAEGSKKSYKSETAI